MGGGVSDKEEGGEGLPRRADRDSTITGVATAVAFCKSLKNLICERE